MTNPTSNYGWQMPTSTDLVTDLPADFEVFGQAVDTAMAGLKGGTTGQILSKTSATDMAFTWITNDQGDITAVSVSSPLTGGGTSGAVSVGIQDALTTQKGAVQLSDSTSTTSSILAATPTAVKSAYDLASSASTTATAAIPKSTVTTNGDLIYGTGSSTVSRIGIGSSGQVLTVAAGIPSWATTAATAQNFTLLNSGGTTLSGTTTTVSSISGKGTILVVVVGAGVTVTGSTQWKFRINTDTGLNYNYSYTQLSAPTSYAATSLTSFNGFGDDSINSGTSNGTSARWNGAMTLAGCNSAGLKTVIFNGSGDGNSNAQVATWGQGHYNSASTISSVSIYANGNTMNAGKIYVYASA